jgi:hypothetical protein
MILRKDSQDFEARPLLRIAMWSRSTRTNKVNCNYGAIMF